MHKRYLELDSLRGLAALFVLFSHCFRVFPAFDTSSISITNQSYVTSALLHTPLRLFIGGHESVLLFFILSGFVLSLPYYRNQTVNYKTYLIKRSCRIYVPYIISISIAIIAFLSFSEKGIPKYSEWFNKIWTYDFSYMSIVNHLSFLGYYNANHYNTAIWSLVHEMRISIIFPLLMYFIFKFNFKKNFVLMITFSCVSFILLKLFQPTYNTNIILTIHYISMFMLGAILARYIENLITFYTKMTKTNKLIISLIALICYTYQGLFPHLSFIHNFIMNEYAVALGSSLIIIIALSSKSFSRFLNLKPILFLGKISYSLYLYHATLLFSFIYIFNDILPISTILCMTVISSLLISSVLYYLVEEPSINLGRKLTIKKESHTALTK